MVGSHSRLDRHSKTSKAGDLICPLAPGPWPSLLVCRRPCSPVPSDCMKNVATALQPSADCRLPSIADTASLALLFTASSWVTSMN